MKIHAERSRSGPDVGNIYQDFETSVTVLIVPTCFTYRDVITRAQLRLKLIDNNNHIHKLWSVVTVYRHIV